MLIYSAAVTALCCRLSAYLAPIWAPNIEHPSLGSSVQAERQDRHGASCGGLSDTCSG
jgi:hypothetical protein